MSLKNLMLMRLNERYHELFWNWMKNKNVKISQKLHDKFVEVEYFIEKWKEDIDEGSTLTRELKD